MRKFASILCLCGVVAALAGCHRQPSPDDPSLKQNIWNKEKATAGGDQTTKPPAPPPAGSK